jgi:putative spermidine/putrescine transport system ATP-binding protein
MPPRPGQDAALVVRPEQMRLGQTVDCQLHGRVVEAVYAGAETRLIVRLASGTELTVRLSAAALGIGIGAEIALGWNRENSTLVLS